MSGKEQEEEKPYKNTFLNNYKVNLLLFMEKIFHNFSYVKLGL